MSGIRFWGDESSPEMTQVAIDSYRREVAARAAEGQPSALPPSNFRADCADEELMIVRHTLTHLSGEGVQRSEQAGVL